MDAEEIEREVMRYMLEGAPRSYCCLPPEERRADARALIELAVGYSDSPTNIKLLVLTELRSMFFFMSDKETVFFWLLSQNENNDESKLTGNC